MSLDSHHLYIHVTKEEPIGTRVYHCSKAMVLYEHELAGDLAEKD